MLGDEGARTSDGPAARLAEKASSLPAPAKVDAGRQPGGDARAARGLRPAYSVLNVYQEMRMVIQCALGAAGTCRQYGRSQSDIE